MSRAAKHTCARCGKPALHTLSVDKGRPEPMCWQHAKSGANAALEAGKRPEILRVDTASSFGTGADTREEKRAETLADEDMHPHLACALEGL